MKNSKVVQGFQKVCGCCEQTTRIPEWTFKPPVGKTTV